MKKRVLLGILLGTLAGTSLAAEVSSLIFFDYTHDATAFDKEADKTKGLNSDGKFNLTRGYLTLTDKPTENLAYKIQLDAGMIQVSEFGKDGKKVLQDMDGDTLTYDLNTGFYAYVKNAMVEWSTDYGRFTVGVQNLNMYGVQEANWGYRFLTAPIMDVCKFSSSADLGVGYFNEMGMFKGSLMLTNGKGYKFNEDDKYKKISLALVAGETTLAKKDGWNAGLTYSMEPYQHETTHEAESRTVASLFGSFSGFGLRVGAEYDMKTTSAGAVDTVTVNENVNYTFEDLGESIIGVYGNYKLPVSFPVDIFAQYYMYDKDQDEDGDKYGLNIHDDRIVGVKFAPVKGMVVAPNIKTTSFDRKDKDKVTYYRVNFEFKI